MADIKVRVGQQNAIKVISSVSGSAGGRSETAKNVIGGIASVTQLSVSGVSTFTGVSTFVGNVYIGGDLYIQDDLTFDEFTARNATITGLTSTVNLVAGIATVTNAFVTGIISATDMIAGVSTVTTGFYYTPSFTNGVAYFDATGLMVSTGSTSSSIDYTNYILTTNNSGIPVWSNTIDGGSY